MREVSLQKGLEGFASQAKALQSVGLEVVGGGQVGLRATTPTGKSVDWVFGDRHNGVQTLRWQSGRHVEIYLHECGGIYLYPLQDGAWRANVGQKSFLIAEGRLEVCGTRDLDLIRLFVKRRAAFKELKARARQ